MRSLTGPSWNMDKLDSGGVEINLVDFDQAISQ